MFHGTLSDEGGLLQSVRRHVHVFMVKLDTLTCRGTNSRITLEFYIRWLLRYPYPVTIPGSSVRH